MGLTVFVRCGASGLCFAVLTSVVSCKYEPAQVGKKIPKDARLGVRGDPLAVCRTPGARPSPMWDSVKSFADPSERRRYVLVSRLGRSLPVELNENGERHVLVGDTVFLQPDGTYIAKLISRSLMHDSVEIRTVTGRYLSFPRAIAFRGGDQACAVLEAAADGSELHGERVPPAEGGTAVGRPHIYRKIL